MIVFFASKSLLVFVKNGYYFGIKEGINSLLKTINYQGNRPHFVTNYLMYIKKFFDLLSGVTKANC